MDKPRKKELSGRLGDLSFHQQQRSGYNDAIDDFEKWLPSVEEIMDIILEPHEIVKGMTHSLSLKKTDPIVLAIATALHKRLQ